VVIINCGFVFANAQSFSHFVYTAWVKHMQVCLKGIYDLPQLKLFCELYF